MEQKDHDSFIGNVDSVILSKEEIDLIIDSALMRWRHNEPSAKTMDMFHHMNDMFNNLNESFVQHKKDMEPVTEFFKTINSLNKFLKWGGISFFAFVAAIYFFIKKL